MHDYDPQTIERKWQRRWSEERAFEVTEDPSRPKYYCLVMFAYPSGHAHVGHVRNYMIGDVIARMKRMQGCNVLHPFGWDAFGMPAENAAIKNESHPERWTRANIAHMKSQLQRLGIGYAWEREIATCDRDYYRWNQWLFLKMYERGLAYRKRSSVNWCPECRTVLANEQVVDGGCWRCAAGVEARDLEQWFLRITHYADELLERIGGLEGLAPQGADDAAELDRAIGGRPRPFRSRSHRRFGRFRRRCDRGLHHAHRHHPRRHVRAAGARASARRSAGRREPRHGGVPGARRTVPCARPHGAADRAA